MGVMGIVIGVGEVRGQRGERSEREERTQSTYDKINLIYTNFASA